MLGPEGSLQDSCRPSRIFAETSRIRAGTLRTLKDLCRDLKESKGSLQEHEGSSRILAGSWRIIKDLCKDLKDPCRDLEDPQGSFPKIFVPFLFWHKYHFFRPFADQIYDLLACCLLNFEAKLVTDHKGETSSTYWGYTCKPNGTNLTGTSTVQFIKILTGLKGSNIIMVFNIQISLKSGKSVFSDPQVEKFEA